MLSFASLFENSAEKAKQGSMVAFFIPSDVGKSIHSLFDDVEGDNVEPEYMHITLGLVRNSDMDDKKICKLMDKASKQISPFRVKIKDFGYFPPNKHNEQKYVLWAKPQSSMLFKLNKALLPELKKHGIKIDNGNFDFNPHITIKYANKKPDLGLSFDKIINLDKISFARGADVKHFSLGG